MTDNDQNIHSTPDLDKPDASPVEPEEPIDASGEKEESIPPAGTTDTLPIHERPLLGVHTSEELKVGKKHRLGRIIFILVVLINIGLVASSVTLFRVAAQKSKTEPQATSSVPTSNPTGQTAANIKPEPPTIKHYVSEPMKLEFDYPSDWRIESTPDNTYLTIQSAPFNVKTLDNKSSQAQASIRIYNKYPEASFDVNDQSVVTTNSEKLSYRNPTKVQRTETNLTYVRDPSIADTGVTSAVFVSGDLSYITGQRIGIKNYRKTNPFLVFKLNLCNLDDCSSFDYLAQVNAQTIQSLDTMQTTKDIIVSMRFTE